MSASPASIHTDMSENSQFPSASSVLDSMLTTRRTCKPSEPGGACKKEDGPQDCRRMSCAPSIPSQQQMLLAPASNPQRDQQHAITTGNPSIQQSPHSSSRTTMATPVSGQYQTIAPMQQQNYEQQAQNYAMFTPQANTGYMYPVSMEQMQQWGMPPSATQQQAAGLSMSTQSSPQFMPLQSVAQPAYSGPNTSSCFVAADAIRSMAADAGPEVEQALGCNDGSECDVSNSLVFDIMDHYAGQDGQRMM